ncbi:hypothetical protein [Escherichia phage PSD2001]|nr:hypothetical protein [Escherichia phage PSD2001]
MSHNLENTITGQRTREQTCFDEFLGTDFKFQEPVEQMYQEYVVQMENHVYNPEE